MSDPSAQPKAHKRVRPLSPHLQVYKPQMTSVLSILHRFCGVALAVGTLLVVAVLLASAMGEPAYTVVMDFIASPVGMFMLFGWSAALFYHLCNGVRHLIWDTGRLFKIEDAYKAGYVVLLISVMLTAGVWYCALNKKTAVAKIMAIDTFAQTYGVEP
jgi:succinate dehydrogenase / fumarate reductase cytochrome b subunit